jgi:hypothetical protein
MYVPNYMPESIEVPGNVTTERYSTRLVFIRRVIWMHLVSLMLVAGAMSLPMPHQGISSTGWTLVGFLVILDIVRIRTRGRREEPWLSCAFFAPVIVLLAALLREMQAIDLPVWAFFIGPPSAALYSALCGRDFSFVGCFFLSLIGSSLIVAVASVSLHLSGSMATWALSANALYLFYWVYDLAALLARRRFGEEPAAVVDLYRDVFNIFGYIPRVIAHWKKHHIWVTPPSSNRHRED